MFRLADIRPAERRPAIAGFLTLLGITAGHTLLETARDALFLARLPVGQLPWMYLGIAGVGLVMSREASGKTDALRRHAVPLALLVAAAVTFGFWAMSAHHHTAFVYALYIWTGLYASWVVVRMWTALGQMFDVTQAKRLYGFIGAGAVLGAVVGATIASALTGITHARHLLLGAAALFVLTALGPAAMFTRGIRDDAVASPVGTVGMTAVDADVLKGQPYVKRILQLVLASTVAVTLVDYLFKVAVAEHVPRHALGSFFATFYMVLSVLALATQLAGVSALLRVVGVHRALWVFPTLLLVANGGLLLVGGLVAAVLLKGVDGTMRHSLHRTTTELLFVPLPDGLRKRAKPFVDLIGQRGGQALASIVILVAVQLEIGPRKLAAGVLVLLALWLVAAVTLRRYYLDLFRATLRQGALVVGGRMPPLDLDALETLFAALNSDRDDEVVAALDILAEQQKAKLIPALVLYHPSRRVVLRALDLMVAAERRDFVPVADRLLSHADVRVRAAALRARTNVMPDEALLRKHAAGDCDGLRATALVGLARHGWISVDESRTKMCCLADSTNDEARRALARAVAEQVHPRFEEVLLSLMASSDPETLLPVVGALAQIRSRRALPLLVPLLAMRPLRSATRAAFRAIGEPAKAALADALADHSLSMLVRTNLPRAVAEIDPAWAAPLLLDALITEEDGLMRFRILRAIGRMRRQNPKLPLDTDKLIAAGRRNVLTALRCIDWRVALEQAARVQPERATPAHELMIAFLRDKEGHALERIFRIHQLWHPTEDFERIYRGLKSPNPRARASSRELLENVLRAPARELTMALVDDVPDTERLDRASQYYTRDTHPTYEALLTTMSIRGRTTLPALVAYHAGELGLEETARVDVEEIPKSTRFVEEVASAARSLIAIPSVRRPVHG